MVKDRNIALVIIFSFLTCGIYAIYWFVVVTDEIEGTLMYRDGSVASGGMAFLYSLLTCGIYTYYWYYKQGQRVQQLMREHNLNGNDNSTLYLIVALLGGSIINMALIQSDLNRVAQVRNGMAPGGYNN